MKVFLVLIAGFLLALLTVNMITHQPDYYLAARIALSLMLLYTALGHFLFQRGMVMMIPELIPFRETLVTATGVLEILAAVGLQIPQYQQKTGLFLVVFFILVMPANIYASVRRINFRDTTQEGPGMGYLWFRIPFQILLIVWSYWSTHY